MSKNFFQDVVPPDKRSIRNIPVMSGRLRKKMMPPEDGFENVEREVVLKEDYSEPVFVKEKKSFFSGKFFLGLALLVICGFIFGMMTVFTSASINIVPKKEAVSFNLSVIAKKSVLPGEKSLKYEVLEVSRESRTEVAANGEEMAEKKSSGAIDIYNDFTSEPQRLIARTRFETPEGLVYRIAESIIVPGKTEAGPGKVEAIVYADEAGEKYNIKKSDFTLPGFKSDPDRYKAFYAKSKSALAGGFVGKIKKVAPADKKAALDKLEKDMQIELEKEAIGKIPDGQTTVRGGIMYDFKEAGQEDGAGSLAVLKLVGTAKVIIFDKRSLAKVITSEYLQEWNGMPSEIRDVSDIVVTFDPDVNLDADTLPLKLVGSSDVYAAINGAEVAQKLINAPKSSLNQVMAQFQGVLSAKASISPVWRKSFPGDAEKIHINIE